MGIRRTDALDPGRTERILAGLGLDTVPEATRSGLATVYGAWCRRVPFDNVRKLIHLRRGDASPLPGDTPEDFFDAWLRHGAGGTCWSGNGALHALLVALGFEARRVTATMMAAPNLPPNHGSVAVATEGEDLVVDASILHNEPLPMRPGAESRVDHPAWGVTGRWVDGEFRIRWRNFLLADWMDCGLNSFGTAAAEFSARHEDTRGWSPFNFGLCVNLIRGGMRIGAARGELAGFDERGEWWSRPADLEERRRFLVEEVGTSEELAAQLPEDRPMAAPGQSSSDST